MLNIIYKGNDNPVVIAFTFTDDYEDDGLLNFTDILVVVGGESYTLLLTPENVTVVSATELRIKIGDTTSLSAGRYQLTIVGFSDIYDDGYVLTKKGNPLSYVEVRD